MKRIFVSLFVVATMAIVILGCGPANPPEPKGEIVKVERRMGKVINPGIKLSCKSAILDYDGRKIILEDVAWFGSWGNEEWLGEISIKGNKLVLQLPSDVEYYVYIGEQKHALPKLAVSK